MSCSPLNLSASCLCFPAARDVAQQQNTTVSQRQSVKGPLSVIVPLHSSSFHLLLPLSLSPSVLVLHLKPCSGNQHLFFPLLLRHPLRTLWIQMVLFCIYSFFSPTLKAPLIRRIEKGDLMRSAPHNFLRGRVVWILIRCCLQNTVKPHRETIWKLFDASFISKKQEGWKEKQAKAKAPAAT